MTTAIKTQKIELSDLKIVRTQNENDRENKFAIQIGDGMYTPTQRFWSSFGSRYLVNRDMFRFFEPEEVLERVIKKNGNSECKVTSYNGDLFAMIDAKKEVITHDQAREILENGAKIQKLSGRDSVKSKVEVVGASFLLDREFDGMSFKISNEEFKCRTRFDIPIDGYGEASAIAGLTRLACINGMISSTKITETILRMQGDMLGSLRRAVETYQNEDGFRAAELRTRVAMETTASVNEVMYCRDALKSRHAELAHKFDRITGDLSTRYGKTSFNTLSDRKKSLVPSDTSCFELVNCLTEVASHLSTPESRIDVDRAIHYMLGKKEFDLEGLQVSKKKDDFTARYFTNVA